MDEAKEKPLDLNASNVEACRICLGTDIKLHSLQGNALGTCMESIGGFSKSFEGLPNYVCYVCSPILIKCSKLIEKSKTADLLLLEIFNKNGQINKLLIEEHKKAETKLQTSLDSYLLLNYYHIKYNDDTNTANCIKIETDPNENKNSIKLKNEMKESEENLKTQKMLMSKEEEMTIDLSNEDVMTIDLSKEEGILSDSDVETVEDDIPVLNIESDDENMGADYISMKAYDPLEGLLAYVDVVPQHKKLKKINTMGSSKREKAKKRKKMYHSYMHRETPTKYQDEDRFVRRYFNIHRRPGIMSNKKYFCKFCPETYYYVDQARDHVINGCQTPSSETYSLGLQNPELAASSNQPVWEDPGGSK